MVYKDLVSEGFTVNRTSYAFFYKNIDECNDDAKNRSIWKKFIQYCDGNGILFSFEADNPRDGISGSYHGFIDYGSRPIDSIAVYNGKFDFGYDNCSYEDYSYKKFITFLKNL